MIRRHQSGRRLMRSAVSSESRQSQQRLRCAAGNQNPVAVRELMLGEGIFVTLRQHEYCAQSHSRSKPERTAGRYAEPTLLSILNVTAG